jgi:hypothetical protein
MRPTWPCTPSRRKRDQRSNPKLAGRKHGLRHDGFLSIWIFTTAGFLCIFVAERLLKRNKSIPNIPHLVVGFLFFSALPFPGFPQLTSLDTAVHLSPPLQPVHSPIEGAAGNPGKRGRGRWPGFWASDGHLPPPKAPWITVDLLIFLSALLRRWRAFGSVPRRYIHMVICQ